MREERAVAGNVWLTFLAELWIAGVMGYMAFSLRHRPRPSTGGEDAALVNLTLALAAVASLALVLHAVAAVAGISP